MPELLLKGWMAENRVTQRELAKLLGISYQSINRKVNGKEDFTMAQARTIRTHYKVSADVFLPL